MNAFRAMTRTLAKENPQNEMKRNQGPSYALLVFGGLAHVLLATTGLLLVRAPRGFVAKVTGVNVSLEDIWFSGAEIGSKGGKLALEFVLTSILSFVGMSQLLIGLYRPRNRMSALPLVVPILLYHAYHCVQLLESHGNQQLQVLGPSERLIPPFIWEAAGGHRQGLWRSGIVFHGFLSSAYLVWVAKALLSNK